MSKIRRQFENLNSTWSRKSIQLATALEGYLNMSIASRWVCQRMAMLLVRSVGFRSRDRC